MQKKTFFILLQFLCSLSTAFAQHYPIQTYTELDGLPSSSVHAINQDNLGQMWFATRAGLVSFDGVEWITHGSDQGLPDRFYGHLEKDDLGRIWTISMRSPVQVAYLENNQWVLLPYLELEHSGWTIHDFKISRQPNGSSYAAAVSDNGYLSVWNGHSWKQIGSTSVFKIIHSVEFHQNNLLIASASGLFALDLKTWEIIETPLSGLPVGPVVAIALNGPSSPIGIVGDKWIGSYDQGRFKLLADDLDFFLPEKHKGVRSLLDYAEGIYFGDSHRLYFFSPLNGNLEPITKSSGLISNGVSCLFLDREGNTWFSSTRGISKLISRRFTHFDSQNGLFKDEVSAIEVRSSGEIVLGHEGGLTFFDPQIRTLGLEGTNELLGRVIDLEEDAHGTLWIAAERLGLASLDGSENLVWHRTEQGLSGDVYALHIDHKGQMWVGTKAGLFRRKNGIFEYVFLPELSHKSTPFIRRIQPGRKESILVVAGVLGVFRIHWDQVTHWSWDKSPEDSFYSAFEKNDGTLWIGTSDGLYKTEKDKLVKTTHPDPVIDRPIYSIVQGPSDQLWFGTDSGVITWDGKKTHHFTPQEGILGGETNRDALQMDNQNRMLIGTDRGLTVFAENYNLSPKAQPIVELLGFEVDNKYFSPSGKLVIENPPHSLVARFRGVSFGNNLNWGINSWLENFEPTWQKPGQWAQREIRYTNLPPGKYRLHLRIERPNGYVGTVITSPEISIGKPYWLRWWFILLEVIVGILLFRIALSFFSTKKYSRQLEKEIRIQTQELRESEKSVRAESRRFIATLNSVSEGVLTLDAEDKIVLCNPAAETILGLPTFDILGKKLCEIIPQLNTAKSLSYGQNPYENPKRGNIWLETTSAPITSTDGKHEGQVLALRDITEKRAKENELLKTQKLESLGRLAGGIAHDFNNLITIILGNIDLAQSSPKLPPDSFDRMEKAKQATQRATSLAEQILTFAQGGAPQRKTLSMVHLVQQTSSIVFSGNPQSCEKDFEKDLWPVLVDPAQLGLAISNICINACQAMPKGGTVCISGKNIDSAPGFLPSKNFVLIEIRDQGVGISKRNINKIFDPYFTTKPGSSGLGLTTAYSIINRHDGCLEVESEEGKGATFRIYLPRSLDDIACPQNKISQPVMAGQKILVMDDEEDVCLIIEGFLARMGLETELTSNGEEAISTFIASKKEGKEFAAVLFDLTIPGGMGGRDAIEQLLKIDPKLKAIVISGYSKDAVMADFSRFGFSASLPKPFNFEELAAVLGQVLGQGQK